MAEFTDYLDSLNRRNRAPSFTDYLENDKLQNIYLDKPSFTDYLTVENRLDNYRKSVLPRPEELEQAAPLGMIGSFAGGFKSGISLGHWGTERTAEEVEAMTTGELFAEAIGGISGGALPFIGASLLTGGYGAPVAGAAYMSRAYQALNLVGKHGRTIRNASKALDKYRKAVTAVGTGKKATANAKRINKLIAKNEKLVKTAAKAQKVQTTKLLKYKKDYIDDLLAQGRTKEARRLTKMPLAPRATGFLGKRKKYQEFLANLAQKKSGLLGLKGFDLAGAANRFFNNAATFSAVGLVSNKPGASILDRIADIPKDVAMGGFFAATGLPRLYGVTPGKSAAIEALGIMGIGAYGDYLTLSPDENMDIRDRIIHGLSLLSFHYVGQGLSNLGVKEKAFRALIDMNFDETTAIEVAYGNWYNDTLVKTRSFYGKEGVIYQHKKSGKLSSIKRIRAIGEDGKNGGIISLVDVVTGFEPNSIIEKNLTTAKNKLNKDYVKFDFNDKELTSDLPESVKQNVDFLRRRQKELTEDRIVDTKELHQEKVTDLENKKKNLEKALDIAHRAYDVEKVHIDELPFLKDKERVYDQRKDIELLEQFYDKELAYLDDMNQKGNGTWNVLFPEGAAGTKAGASEKWPDRYSWMDYNMRHDLTRWLRNNRWKRDGKGPTTQELQNRIKSVQREQNIRDNVKMEPDYPARYNNPDSYKVGDVIVIPKITDNRISNVDDIGTSKAFDNNQAQLARITSLKPKGERKNGDDYVIKPGRYTVEVETFNENGKKIKVLIDLQGGGKDRIGSGTTELNIKDDWKISDLDFSDKEPVPEKWWRDLTPEQRKEYLRKRADAEAKSLVEGLGRKPSSRPFISTEETGSDLWKRYSNLEDRIWIDEKLEKRIRMGDAYAEYGHPNVNPKLRQKSLANTPRGRAITKDDAGNHQWFESWDKMGVDNEFAHWMWRNFGSELESLRKELRPQILAEIEKQRGIKLTPHQRSEWLAKSTPGDELLLAKFFNQAKHKDKYGNIMDVAWAEKMQRKVNTYNEFNMKSLSRAAKVDKSDYNIGRFENAMPVTTGLNTPFVYLPRLKLGIIDDKGDFKGDYKAFNLENFEEPASMIFSTEADLRNQMRNQWELPEAANRHLQDKISRYKSEIERYKRPSGELAEYKKQKGALNKAFKKNEFEAWDKKAILRLIYPESKGNIDNLSARQLKRVREFVSDDIASEKYYDTVINSSLPDGWYTKVASPFMRQVLKLLGKTALPIATVYEMLPGVTGKRVAFKLKEFSRWRTDILGSHIAIINEMERQLSKKGIKKMKYVNEHIQAFMDDKYKKLQADPEYVKFREKMEAIRIGKGRESKNGLQYVIDNYRDLNEKMAMAQISSTSWIKISGKNKYKKFINIVDRSGRDVVLTDFHKNPELHIRQVASFLEWAISKKRKKYVINNKGKQVVVNPKKSHHYYQQEYSRRVISEEFKELMTDSRDAEHKAVAYAVENDKQFAHIRDKTEREEVVRTHLANIKNMFDEKGVYGQQFTRIADLPTHLYKYVDEHGGKRLIQLGKDGEFKPEGGLYKSGESVTDVHGQKRKISDIVPVYESEYGKLMQDYSEGIAHSTAAYSTYFLPFADRHGNIIGNLAEKVARETGDNSWKEFTTNVIKNQMFGDKGNWFSKVATPMVRWNAIAGLSSPLSGLKNVLLGNVQNATVFTTRELLKTLKQTFSKKGMYGSEKLWAERIGATYTGAYDLYLGEIGPSGWMKKYLPDLGGMRTTEIFNRTMSNAIGRVALDTHIDNLAGIKHPSGRGLNKMDSRRIMMDVFEFSPEQITGMIKRRRTARNTGNEMQYTSLEEKRARTQAHIITQGSGELPFVPYWMGKAWARPLTLFYRIAYRMTETVAKNVIKPIIVEGNMVPAMKYLPLTVGAGYALMQVYDWLFDEQRVNKFKDLPSQYFEYFIKAEGLALFSNMYDAHGGVFESYKPVILRNADTFVDNVESIISGTKKPLQGIGDGVKSIVAAANTADRAYKNLTNDVQRKFIASRRRQTQYLDAYYPREKLDIDFDGGLTTKSPHYRMLKDVFWHTDNDVKAQRYYSALAYLSHRIMIDKRGLSYAQAEKEARTRLKRTVSRLRPIPQSWRKTRAQTKGTRYREYLSRLTPEQKEQEDIMENTYLDKRREFFQSIAELRNKYYKRG
jgi:hypothetical protein